MAIIFASCWTWSNDSPDYPNIHHSIKMSVFGSYSGTHFPAFGLDTEIRRIILNLFTIFLRKDFVRTKSTKTKTSKNTKHKYANKNRKCLKTSKRKKVTHSLMWVFALATKKIEKSLQWKGTKNTDVPTTRFM